MNNTLTCPKGTTRTILIPVTNPDGTIYQLTSNVLDIRFLVKYDAMDPDLPTGVLGAPGYVRGALVTKSLVGGGVVISNSAAGLAVATLVPADTNNATFNALVPLEDVTYLYFGCKLFLTSGVEYDLLDGQWGSFILNQGGVQNIS